MPPLTLNQAAKAAHKSKSALLEAISSGRMSAVKNELNQWQIEPVELFRVYPQNQTYTEQQNRSQPLQEPHRTDQETAALMQQITWLGQERDRERQQLQSTITDLRQRLDDESSERRKLTAMLTHQNQAKPAENRPTSSRMTWLIVLLVLVSFGSVMMLKFGFVY